MGGLPHMILSMPIKDRNIGGPLVILNACPAGCKIRIAVSPG